MCLRESTLCRLLTVGFLYWLPPLSHQLHRSQKRFLPSNLLSTPNRDPLRDLKVPSEHHIMKKPPSNPSLHQSHIQRLPWRTGTYVAPTRRLQPHLAERRHAHDSIAVQPSETFATLSPRVVYVLGDWRLCIPDLNCSDSVTRLWSGVRESSCA